MKRFWIFTAAIACVTLIGFWGGKKTCILMCQGTLKANPYCHYASDLAPEQAQSLGKLENSFRRGMDKTCMEICRERWALLSMMESNPADTDAINKKIEEIGAMQISLEKETAAHILEAQKTLTPQQSKAYVARLKAQLGQSIRDSGYGEVTKE